MRELVVPARGRGRDKGVVDGVDLEQLAVQIPVGRIPVGKESVRIGVGRVAMDTLVEQGVVVGAVVDEVAIVEGIAAGFEAEIFDDESVEDEHVGEAAVGVDVGDLANECGLFGIAVETFLHVRDGGNVVHHEGGRYVVCLLYTSRCV